MTWINEDIKAFIAAAADVMVQNKNRLIKLDSVVGDGDLGLTMSDGFAAANQAMQSSSEQDIGKLLYTGGKAMASAVPSSMGTLMSAGLMGAGKALKGMQTLENDGIAIMMRAWYEGVKRLGKANPGEKTFLDGLLPAVEVLEQGVGEADYAGVVFQAAQAAQDGADATVGMLAMHGRAAIRGEESRKLLDPGAIVAVLLMQAMTKTIR